MQNLYSQAKILNKRFQSQPARLMIWCLGIALLMQTPAAEHTPHRNVCGGKELRGAKTTSFVQINSQLKKEHVEEEEPLPENVDDSTPILVVAKVTSPAATLHTKVVPPNEDLSNRTMVEPPGKDSSSKPSDSVSLHPEVVPRGQAYQGQAPSDGRALEYAADVRKADKDVVLAARTQHGTNFLLEFKRISMLLRDHMILRLRQWHEFAANMGQQRSAAVTAALVGAGVLILILTFAVLSYAQTGGRRSALSDYRRSGQSRGFSERNQRGTVSKLSTARLQTKQDATPRPPQTTDVVGLSQPLTMGQGPEGTEEQLDPDSYFCPDLVVPPGCEVILKVPTTTLSQGPFDITDVHDNAVLHVEPRALNFRPSIVRGGRDAEQRQQHRLVLTTESGEIMAQCGPSLTQAGECDLLRAAGDQFAKIISTEEKAYTLTTRTGLKLFFWGSFEDTTVNVIESSGRLIAKTSSISERPASGETTVVATSQSLQGSPIYSLRVAPLMDVGLVLCGLLCIQHIM